MPPKAKITAEMIAQAGTELIRAEGLQALNVRNTAKQLGCSTQPVMYHYPTVGALKEAVYAQADALHTAYLMQPEAENPLLSIGLRYIRFASEERNLFRFLFQSGMMRDTPLRLVTVSPDTAPFIAAVAAETGLTEQQAQDVFTLLFMTVHGCASLLANQAMEYDAAYCEKLLARSLSGAAAAVKGEADEKTL